MKNDPHKIESHNLKSNTMGDMVWANKNKEKQGHKSEAIISFAYHKDASAPYLYL